MFEFILCIYCKIMLASARSTELNNGVGGVRASYSVESIRSFMWRESCSNENPFYSAFALECSFFYSASSARVEVYTRIIQNVPSTI